MPQIAFVTAFDEYAVKAFELNAVDYLLKPVEKVRVMETISRAVERLEREDHRMDETTNVRNAAKVFDSMSGHDLLERIPVKKRNEILLVPVGDVVSVVADGELLIITTFDGEKHVINFRLKDLESRLDESKFVRLSRGAIVNIDAIKQVSPLPGGTYLIQLKNGREIASSRLRSKLLRGKLLKI
jgi:two-component system LytT family response regulator